MISEIESQIRDIQEKKKQQAAEEEKAKGIGFDSSGFFDSEFYDNGKGKGKYEGYVTSIAANEDEDDDDDEPLRPQEKQRTTGFGAPIALINDVSRVNLKIQNFESSKMLISSIYSQGEPDYDPFENRRVKTVGEKEDEYRQKRRNQILSPERIDPFADGKFRN
jgi:splicing factor 3B subunit 1